jgi:hypothetical protein
MLKSVRHSGICLLGILVCIASGCNLQTAGQGKELAQKAESLYDAGDKAAAKIIYQKAADIGDANAHFALAYRYVVPHEVGTEHYVAAAVQGHEKALSYALDSLLFRAGDWARADPVRAMDTYQKAKKANSSFSLYNEKNVVDVIKICVEAGRPQDEQFWKQYKAAENEEGTFWYFKIAEKAANTDFFGKRSNLLALQIVCNNSSIPAELQYAAKDLYSRWKKDDKSEFKACEHATSREHTLSCICKEGSEKECDQATLDLYGRAEENAP